jgi:hypothetical protein
VRIDQYTLTRGTPAWRWACAFPIGIVAVYIAFFLLFLNQSGPRDFDQFLVFHKLQYWNTSLFGISKQWTPVMCGGLSLAGEPQVPFMSLSMALSYLMEPSWGLRLATLLYFVAGWVGALLYSGLWFKQLGQRTLAAALFIGNGFFICRLGYGHIDFIPFLILPLVLWLLHRCMAWLHEGWSLHCALKLFTALLMMGGMFALAIDGSPVAIIHLLLWIGLYALVLALTLRSVLPVLLFLTAALLAAVLDAGYLWPMLQAQTVFPRRTPDSFTSVLSFLWFALLPVRGKVLPANGNGHELSVFIGPVLAFLMWKYRHWLRANLPRDMKRPLLVVAFASIVLGMGSLKALHVPVWLSPFDMLRPLPGFRSVGVTGRYWGFLALPLSMLGAAVLWRFLAETRNGLKLSAVAGFALLLQLGFQSSTLLAHWVNSPLQTPAATGSAFRGGPETIDYVQRQTERLQGEFITPTRAVVNCYDMDDFIHADIAPGQKLVKRIADTANRKVLGIPMQARFVTWSHIRLTPDDHNMVFNDRYDTADSPNLRVVLNQAYHPLWKAAGCTTLRSERGNLILECPAAQVRGQSIDLTFDDQLSRVAANTSQGAWESWLIVAGLLLLGLGAMRFRKSVDANGLAGESVGSENDSSR